MHSFSIILSIPKPMDTTPRLVALHSAVESVESTVQIYRKTEKCSKPKLHWKPTKLQPPRPRPPGERTMYVHRIKIRYRYIGVLTNSILESCVHNVVIFHYGPHSTALLILLFNSLCPQIVATGTSQSQWFVANQPVRDEPEQPWEALSVGWNGQELDGCNWNEPRGLLDET